MLCYNFQIIYLSIIYPSIYHLSIYLSIIYVSNLSFLKNSVQILSSFQAQYPYNYAYVYRDNSEIEICLTVSQLCIPIGFG